MAVLIAAVQAAPLAGQPEQWRLRMCGDRVELHAEPSRQPPTVDPLGRARTLAGGAALRNLELAVTSLGHSPVVESLPAAADEPPCRAEGLHLATVALGPRRPPDPADLRLHRAMLHRRSFRRPFAARSVPPALTVRLHGAPRPPGVAAVPVCGAALRCVSTVLAAAANARRTGEDDLADLALWLSGPANGAALADHLGRGRLLLITTAADRPVDWLHAGWAVQSLWLTAASMGLAGSLVGGALDAPGVRAALAARLRLDGCPQLLLRIGWAPSHLLSG